MEIKFPARDRLNNNKERFIKGLEKQLSLIADIKSDLLKMKNYETMAIYRDFEKQIEKQIFILKEV
jgi:hypothetical protein